MNLQTSTETKETKVKSKKKGTDLPMKGEMKQKLDSALKDLKDIYGGEAYDSNEEGSSGSEAEKPRETGIYLKPMQEHPKEQQKRGQAHAASVQQESQAANLPPAPPKENKKTLDGYTGIDDGAKQRIRAMIAANRGQAKKMEEAQTKL